MQIKRFEARNMAEAFRDIKQELGPDAVILSAKSIKPQASLFKSKGYAGVEVMAATDNLIMKPGVGTSYQRAVNQYSELQHQPQNEPDIPKTGLLQSIGTKISPLSGIRNIRKKNDEESPGEAKLHHHIKRRLESNEVDGDIQGEILQLLASKKKAGYGYGAGDMQDRLTTVLDHMGVCTIPDEKISTKQHMVVLMGLTGVGKTTSIVKLAANRILESNLSVGVISLDVHRVASNALLNVYAGIMDFNVEYISHVNEVNKTLKKLKDKQLIFIDTPGISLNDKSLGEDIKELLDKINPDEIHLVMPPYMKKNDAEAIIKRFEIFDFNRLFFTKLDETTVYGAMINLSIFADVPISYFTFGQNVPEDIDMMAPDKMAELILGHHKAYKTFDGFEKRRDPNSIQNGMNGIGYN